MYTNKKIVILSIDGGGIRGLIAASFIKELENDLNKSLYDTFDMFAGSSVGSFIALAISGLKYNGSEILALFNDNNIKTIFTKHFLSFLSIFYNPKYSGKGKREVLKKIFSTKRFLDIEKQTLVTAYDIINNRSVIFKRYSINNSDAAYNPLIAEVADASSASPTYFPTVKTSEKQPRWLIDGGIAANDPAMCILTSALRMQYELSNIKLISLGAGISSKMLNNAQKYGAASQHWGGVGWLKHGIINDLFNGNKTVVEYQAKQLLKNNYYRVNHPLNLADDELDNISDTNLNQLRKLGKIWYEHHKKSLLSFLYDE